GNSCGVRFPVHGQSAVLPTNRWERKGKGRCDGPSLDFCPNLAMAAVPFGDDRNPGSIEFVGEFVGEVVCADLCLRICRGFVWALGTGMRRRFEASADEQQLAKAKQRGGVFHGRHQRWKTGAGAYG